MIETKNWIYLKDAMEKYSKSESMLKKIKANNEIDWAYEDRHGNISQIQAVSTRLVFDDDQLSRRWKAVVDDSVGVTRPVTDLSNESIKYNFDGIIELLKEEKDNHISSLKSEIQILEKQLETSQENYKSLDNSLKAEQMLNIEQSRYIERMKTEYQNEIKTLENKYRVQEILMLEKSESDNKPKNIFQRIFDLF